MFRELARLVVCGAFYVARAERVPRVVVRPSGFRQERDGMRAGVE